VTVDTTAVAARTRAVVEHAPATRWRARPWVVAPRFTLVLTVLALATVVLRLALLGAPLSADESGFLQVASHWHGGGGSLYGPYFVDRPPLLLEIFRVADLLGGLLAWRLIGTLAAAVTVVCVGMAARRLAGGVAGCWAALAAGALMVSPALGTAVPNGELAAAPFVAGGVWSAVTAVSTSRGPLRTRAAFLTGACATAAPLVKQNMLDVVVFAVALGVVMAWRQRDQARALLHDAGSALVGALVVAGAVLGVAASRGTSPAGVFYAMYPFRLQAAAVLTHQSAGLRLAHLYALGKVELSSLGPIVLVALLVVLATRRLRPASATPAAVAVLVVAAYDVVSIVAGGSYWQHYLVELIVPTALAGGLVAASTSRRVLRPVVAAMAAVAVLAWAGSLFTSVLAEGQVVGESVRVVAQPGDTLVSALGDADMVQAAGLSSPYAYLWSLPARTLDPHGAQLDDVLADPTAPTWVVVRGPQTAALLAQQGAGQLLQQRYHLVAHLCGRPVYLRDGVDRPTPTPPTAAAAHASECRLPVAPWLHHLQGRG
jgi:hypothetical protein